LFERCPTYAFSGCVWCAGVCSSALMLSEVSVNGVSCVSMAQLTDRHVV
jgi:hypothetical protein